MTPNEMTDDMRAAYLAAFIDGEGHVGLSRIKKTGYYTREISFSNTDKILIDSVIAICEALGFPTSTYFKARVPPERDQWTVRISGKKSVYQRFEQLIPLQAPAKRQKIRDIIESYEDRDALTIKRRQGEETICAQCGIHFYAPPSERARFCSRACHGKASIMRVTKICETCGTSFEVIRAKAQARFCSSHCFGKSQASRMSELGKRTIAGARRKRQISRSFIPPYPT